MNPLPFDKKVFIPATKVAHVHFGVLEPERVSLSTLVGLGASWTHIYFRTLSNNSYCIYSPLKNGTFVLKKGDNRGYGYEITPEEMRSLSVVNGDSFFYGTSGSTTPVIEIVALNRNKEYHVSKVTACFMPTTIHVLFDFFQQTSGDETGVLDPCAFAKLLVEQTRKMMGA